MPKTPAADRKKLFVLDTNVLMHNPLSLFHFQDNDIFICLPVIEELDNNKKGGTMAQRHARMSANSLDQFRAIAVREKLPATAGISITEHERAGDATGKIFFQDVRVRVSLLECFDERKKDNLILSIVDGLQKEARFQDHKIIVVSMDTNFRIKCGLLGFVAEEYSTGAVFDDSVLLGSGVEELPIGYFQGLDFRTENINSIEHYFLPPDPRFLTGNFAISADPGAPFKRAFVLSSTEVGVELVTVWSYSNGHRVFGLKEKNLRQGLAMWALMNPEIDIVVLNGLPGSGKTLLSLAAGLEQTAEGGDRPERYDEINIMLSQDVVGRKELGFLPGDVGDKLKPWMAPYADSLDVLFDPDDGVRNVTRKATEEAYITSEAIAHERGRTRHRRYVIVGEAQNRTPQDIELLITRAGKGTKFVIEGNLAQIDETAYVSEHTSGLSFLISRFRGTTRFAHITLEKSERSPLSEKASQLLAMK